MVTFLIVLFALLLAFFCVVCFVAPRVVVRYAHTEPEVFDGIVVATMDECSIVRATFGKLYYLRKLLPLETEVVLSVPQEDCPSTLDLPKYLVFETSGTRAQVIRRLNEEVLLCRYGDKEILVECNVAAQSELTQRVEIPFRTYESLGVNYTETEDALVIPFIRLHEQWQIPICCQEG